MALLRARQMQEQDIDDVYAMEMAAHRTPWSYEILLDCLRVKYDCRVLEIDSDTGFLIVGYIMARLNEGVCHVLNLCIAPLSQGKGYGTYLLKNMFDSLPNLLVDTIILEVRPSNLRAMCLYQKMGFVKQRVKRGYYRDDGHPEDAIVLQKKLV